MTLIFHSNFWWPCSRVDEKKFTAAMTDYCRALREFHLGHSSDADLQFEYIRCLCLRVLDNNFSSAAEPRQYFRVACCFFQAALEKCRGKFDEIVDLEPFRFITVQHAENVGGATFDVVIGVQPKSWPFRSHFDLLYGFCRPLRCSVLLLSDDTFDDAENLYV